MVYIYANIKGVYGWDPWHTIYITIYSSTMDPSWDEVKICLGMFGENCLGMFFVIWLAGKN